MRLFRPLLTAGSVALASTVLQPLAPAQSPADLPQAPAPTAAVLRSYQQTLPDGVELAVPTGDALPLSLDDAVARGLKQNLQVELSRQNRERVRGLQSTTVNALIPNLSAQAYTNTQEINLAAMGFKPQALSGLLQNFGLSAADFSTIVKVNVTSAQLNLSQQLFNVPAYFLYRAAKSAGNVADLSLLNVRGDAVFQVGTQYLRILADTALINNARAQLESDQVALEQARQRQAAGVGVHLDTLRAEVQVKTQEQALVNAETTFAKDRIQLNRLMGIAADQELKLTDTVPFQELADMPHDDRLRLAYTRRKDLLVLEAQLEVSEKTERAVRYARLPTLAMGGYYGVLGETTGLYHGVFTAQGSLNFPIFDEAQLRGEREVAVAQTTGLRQQIASLKVTIDQDIRSSELDLTSTSERVKVARSNVELARQELSDSEDRFQAGVEDNLPVVQAQGTLAAAESQLVQAIFQYNVSKLRMARSTGVTESEYKLYLRH